MKRRRRKNPFMQTLQNDLIWWVALGVGGYYVFKNVIPKLTGPGSAFDAATSGIASMFPGTSPSVEVQGTVILPDGSSAPISSFKTGGFNDDGSLSATSQNGTPYNLLSGGGGQYIAFDPNENY